MTLECIALSFRGVLQIVPEAPMQPNPLMVFLALSEPTRTLLLPKLAFLLLVAPLIVDSVNHGSLNAWIAPPPSSVKR